MPALLYSGEAQIFVKELRYMPATYARLTFLLRTLQIPLTSGIIKWVVKMAFNVQTAGLAIEKNITSIVSYKASLLYSRIFGLAF